MSTQNSTNKTQVSLERIEAGLACVAKQLEVNQIYLPLFERLLEERDAIMRQQSLREQAKAWAR